MTTIRVLNFNTWIFGGTHIHWMSDYITIERRESDSCSIGNSEFPGFQQSWPIKKSDKTEQKQYQVGLGSNMYI